VDPKVEDLTRFGIIRMDEENRIRDFEEKPLVASSNHVSAGIYVLRRRLLIDLVEQCAGENRYDFVNDILVRYRNVKRIYGYKIPGYWSSISSVESYFRTNMDFLKPEVRDYFFRQFPSVYSKIEDLPPAKYNVGSCINNSLISSGCIINSTVENTVLFKKVFVGNNCTIKNSIILNDVYIGDNTHIENCIVESRGTIPAGSNFRGEGEIKIVMEEQERYNM
jgi:glucose-1-phosphate adenylyltransferase